MNGEAARLAIVVSSLATMAFADVPPPKAPASGNLDNDVAIILDNPLPESQYSDQLRCISARSYRSVEVLDTGHVLFWGYNGHVWLNQLRPACIGLDKDQILTFAMRGDSICELDRFEGMDRYNKIGVLAMCGLQRFEAITPEQANELRETLRRRAHTTTSVPTSKSAPPAPQSPAPSQPEAEPQHE